MSRRHHGPAPARSGGPLITPSTSGHRHARSPVAQAPGPDL